MAFFQIFRDRERASTEAGVEGSLIRPTTGTSGIMATQKSSRPSSRASTRGASPGPGQSMMSDDPGKLNPISFKSTKLTPKHPSRAVTTDEQSIFGIR